MFVCVSAIGSHTCGRILMKIYREVQGHPRKVLGPKIFSPTLPWCSGSKKGAQSAPTAPTVHLKNFMCVCSRE